MILAWVYLSLAGTAASAGALTLAQASPEFAGKGTNYILSALCTILICAICSLVKFLVQVLRENKETADSYAKSLNEITQKCTEVLTEVRDALRENTLVLRGGSKK